MYESSFYFNDHLTKTLNTFIMLLSYPSTILFILCRSGWDTYYNYLSLISLKYHQIGNRKYHFLFSTTINHVPIYIHRVKQSYLNAL